MWWFMKALRINRVALLPASAATAWIALSAQPTNATGNHHHSGSNFLVAKCEKHNKKDDDDESATLLIRKRATIAKANAMVSRGVYKRTNTREELSKIRGSQDEMFLRWERDEDGWRELPARAWPKYQPNPEQLVGIQEEVKKNGCSDNSNRNSSSDLCRSLLFNVATAMVFHTVDPIEGFRRYEELANNGHVDSMVACGVILTEGLGAIRNREIEGVNWLKKAVALGSTQALYELGTIYYTGIDGVVWEDSEGAYKLFEKAAMKGHVGAMYMTADCLIEGEGTETDVARAIPLLYSAADQGHRFARQRVRELLSMKSYQ